jgi:hypothetical protein
MFEKPTTSFTTKGPTVYVLSDNGIVILFQIVYSTMNSWSHTCQCTIRVYHPDWKKCISLSKSGSDLVVTEKNIKCGSFSLSIIDQDSKQGFMGSFCDQEVKVEFELIPLTELFQVGTGTHLMQQTPEQGWIQSQFIPKANIKGFCEYNGKQYDIKGHGFYSMVTQYLPQNIAQWNFCTFYSGLDSIMLYQVFLFLISFIYLILPINLKVVLF